MILRHFLIFNGISSINIRSYLFKGTRCDEYEAFQKGDITKDQFIDWMLKYPEYSKNYANPLPRKEWLERK